MNEKINNFDSYILMGPKKEIKKDVVEEPVKEQEPEIPLHELQGYGRFEYLNGVIY